LQNCRISLAIFGSAKNGLGSQSTYTRAGFGGFAGRPLRSGDMLHGYLDDGPMRDEMTFSEPRSLGLDQAIPVVLGPQDDYFTAVAIEEFLHGSYTIMPASDRMGVSPRRAVACARERLQHHVGRNCGVERH